MMVTLQTRHFLVTAYPYAGGVRAQASLLGGGEAAAGDIQMLCDMAKELYAAGQCLGAVSGWIKEEREAG